MCLQDGYTPLHRASENGHADVVKLLLALEGLQCGQYLAKATDKAHASDKGQDGWTPLHYASEKGHADVAKLLLALEGREELAKAKDKVSVVGEACVWWLLG
jgi:ankyrin repeat protein